MNDKTEQLLRDLASKLGVTVEHLWGVMIRGNRVEGFILLGFVLIGVSLVIGGILSVRFGLTHEDQYDEEFVRCGSVSAIIGIIVFCATIYWCVMDLVVPEYGAMCDLLSHLK